MLRKLQTGFLLLLLLALALGGCVNPGQSGEATGTGQDSVGGESGNPEETSGDGGQEEPDESGSGEQFPNEPDDEYSKRY